ncbi:adenosylcobalamin-dependent ribonucleoside-diphosphate reductase (plasmid) [Brevibacillus halotolerans]|nr:adenosylcobalamin-dependent ribonucleoside-diphosphate reductase [Brevibacillus halotolerans]
MNKQIKPSMLRNELKNSQLSPIELQGFHRKLFLTRYAKKSSDKLASIQKDSLVITLVKDGKYPIREIGRVTKIEDNTVHMILESGENTGNPFKQKLELVDVLLETQYSQTAKRVAQALASVEKTTSDQIKYHSIFKEVIENFLLVPSGRILAGSGDDTEVTLFNCYVIDVEPAPHAPQKGRDSRQAIFHHESRISEIMARGGGVGSCLSVFRPRYGSLSKTKGQSAGAIFIGNRFSGLTDFINQGNRRGAQMLTIHDWHPDLFYTSDMNSPDYNEDFIGAKRKPGFMEGNNSSVLVSDQFMYAVEHDLDWHLKFPDFKHSAYDAEWNGILEEWEAKGYPVIIHRTVKARDIWDKLMVANHSSAEPGIIFIDTVQRDHNGWYLGPISATNPCGEQPILGNSTCNLSAINYGRMIKIVGEDDLGYLYEIDWDLLRHTIHAGIRFLDNAIDKTFYFDEEMKFWQQGERRVGLGGMGVADLLIALRIRYGSNEGNLVLEKLNAFLRDESYRASIEIAKEKGPFPFFDVNKFMESGFVKRLPTDIQTDIRKYGIRNLTLNTYAPTGTTGSMTPSLLDINGSVSTGIEPHYAMKYNRLSRIGSTVQYAGVAKAFMDRNPNIDKLPEWFVGSMDLTPAEHVSVQAITQKYIDSSISKTVNAPSNYTVEQCAEVYLNLYKSGCKGGTIYRDGSRDEQILTVGGQEESQSEASIVHETTKKKGKYDNWECGNCGNKEFMMIEGCPQCNDCRSQSCSI